MTGAWSLLAIAGPERRACCGASGPIAEVPGAGPRRRRPGPRVPPRRRPVGHDGERVRPAPLRRVRRPQRAARRRARRARRARARGRRPAARAPLGGRRAMSFLLTCPHCGERPAPEFAFGGTVGRRRRRRDARPAQREALLQRQRRRRAARALVPPLRLRALDGRAPRHAHERGLGGLGRACESAVRLPARDGERIRRDGRVTFTLRRPRGRGLRGRHARLGALRVGPADLHTQLQVPPPARADVLLRQLRELPDGGRRRAERARVHAPGRGRRGGPVAGRDRLARARPAARDRPRRRPVHAGRASTTGRASARDGRGRTSSVRCGG